MNHAVWQLAERQSRRVAVQISDFSKKNGKISSFLAIEILCLSDTAQPATSDRSAVLRPISYILFPVVLYQACFEGGITNDIPLFYSSNGALRMLQAFSYW